MVTTIYQSYEIEAKPEKLADGSGWTVSYYIWKHRSVSSVNKQFSTEQICETEKEATRQCFEAGKWIIENDFEKIADL